MAVRQRVRWVTGLVAPRGARSGPPPNAHRSRRYSSLSSGLHLLSADLEKCSVISPQMVFFAVVWGCFHWRFSRSCWLVVWDAHAMLTSRKEAQSFEVMAAEVEKARPKVSGMRLKYHVLIIFPKCLLYIV